MGLFNKLFSRNTSNKPNSNDSDSNRRELLNKVLSNAELLHRNLENLEYVLNEGFRISNNLEGSEKEDELITLKRNYHQDLINTNENIKVLKRGIIALNSSYNFSFDTNFLDPNLDKFNLASSKHLEEVLKNLNNKMEAIDNVIKQLKSI